MKIEDLKSILVAQFGDSSVVDMKTDAVDPWLVVNINQLVEICQFLRDDPRLKFEHLNDLTGVDYFEPDEKKRAKATFTPHIDVVYHLSSFTLKHRTVIKVNIPRWKDDVEGQLPEIPSVAGIWGIADWHEREAYDLLGIVFTEHPNLKRILCPEDWEGHALRKDYQFPLEYHGIRGK